jgi:E3 ubiquitin-protein ligase BRE1
MLHSAAESKAVSLEKTLAGLHGPDVVRHIKLEAETRQKLSEVTAQLENYQRIYGDSSLPPDLSRLAKQLKQKDEEIQQLRLIKDQQSQVRCF